MTVNFYQTSKKQDSTAVPTTILQTYTAVYLKDDTSVIRPVITLDLGLNFIPGVWNYCYIQEFSRYYFIRNASYKAGIWSLECEVDVLGTFSSQIKQQTLFVERASYLADGSDISDMGLIDSFYPATVHSPTYSYNSVTNPLYINGPTVSNLYGTFIVGIIAGPSYAGCVTYYAMTQEVFLYFCYYLYTYSSGWLNISTTELSQELQQALVNPFQYVVSCQYLPIDISYLQDAYTATLINFGWWQCDVSTGSSNYYVKIVLPGFALSRSVSITIPRHPNSSRGYYLNVSPYAYYTLSIYPFGTISLDSEAISGYNTVDVFVDIDVITGVAIAKVSVMNNNPLRVLEAQVGIQIPTASIQVNIGQIGSTQSIVSGGAALFDSLVQGIETFTQDPKQVLKDVFAGNYNSQLKSTANTVISAAAAASANVELIGSQGNFSGYRTQDWILSGRFLPVSTQDIDHFGVPVMAPTLLSLLSGFIKCRDADVEIACYDVERSAINAYCNSGFYIE